jgi:hypothetical protein
MESDIIQQQKLEWMAQAAREDTEADIFVWIDYGIMHCPRVTEECISAMLHRVEQSGSMDEIVIPGCWEKGVRSTAFMDNNSSPCWRFCGGVVVCPRPFVELFAAAAKADSSQSIIDTNNVGWEVNTWARVERKNILPIKWYYADHDNGMFDYYKGNVPKKVKLVTGFVPLVARPGEKPRHDYAKLGARLTAIPVPMRSFVNFPVEDCWLWKFLQTKPDVGCIASWGYMPYDPLEYRAAQHQKVEWMLQAASEDPEPDVFVWMDYGIMDIVGINEITVMDFLKRVSTWDDDCISIPGFYKQRTVDDSTYNWRFGGAVLVCPRKHLAALDAAIKDEAIRTIEKTNNVTWEINTWARVELEGKLPIRWYYAQHDIGMLRNGTPLCELAYKWGSDKVGHHEYTATYYDLLKERRYTTKRVLEIGIGHPGCMGHISPNYRIGASLYMWQEFFPNALVYGFDIRPDTMIAAGRIKTFLCDQGDPSSITQASLAAGGHFDLIVDDGSHQPAHQINSMNVLLPQLAAGGLYIIEDIEVDWNILACQVPAEFEYQIIDCPNKERKCLCGCGGPEKLMVIHHC